MVVPKLFLTRGISFTIKKVPQLKDTAHFPGVIHLKGGSTMISKIKRNKLPINKMSTSHIFKAR